jgi:hypothetical protein
MSISLSVHGLPVPLRIEELYASEVWVGPPTQILMQVTNKFLFQNSYDAVIQVYAALTRALDKKRSIRSRKRGNTFATGFSPRIDREPL